MRQQEYRVLEAERMSENDLMWKVTRQAQQLGYLVYHTHDSRRSERGFPDLVLVGRGRFLVRELKRQREHPTKDQKHWISQLRQAGVDAGVWRPADLLSGRVVDELAGERP